MLHGAHQQAIALSIAHQYRFGMPRLPFDPIAEAHQRWLRHWPEQAERMAAVTSVMRVKQVLLAEIERTLRPFDLTFACYEMLRLLAFTRHGQLPMGKMGERLMVHPASVTHTVDRLEGRGLLRRLPSARDRRQTLAELTVEGRAQVDIATAALNDAEFALGAIDEGQASMLCAILRTIRLANGDFDATEYDPWASADPPEEAWDRKPGSRVKFMSTTCAGATAAGV